MSLFSKKTEDKDKKTDEKSVKVDSGKKQSMKDLYGGLQNAQNNYGDTKIKKKDIKKEKKQVKKYGNAYRILVKPLITEKATNLGVENKYVFEVAKKSNKIEIAKAIDEVYGIKPVNINIINMQGKKARYGRITGRRKDWKKAIIELQKGKTIKVYEGV
ncbi:MAG: 50S ribosomal protein L23 [Candidatus Falkowbacteria bacterium]